VQPSPSERLPGELLTGDPTPGASEAARPGTVRERLRVALSRPAFGVRSREENVAVIVVIGCVVLSCLTAMVFKGAPHPSWSAKVRGVPVRYVLSGPNSMYLGRAHTFVPFSPCLVEVALDPTWTTTLSFTSFAAWISAHELGHCLDSRALGFNHNDITRYVTPATRERNDETNPAELFAESYAEAYLRKCGDNLHALGWQVPGPACEPPDPASIIHPGSGLMYQLEMKDKNDTRKREGTKITASTKGKKNTANGSTPVCTAPEACRKFPRVPLCQPPIQAAFQEGGAVPSMGRKGDCVDKTLLSRSSRL